MIRRIFGVACLLCVAGCVSLFGIDELSFDPTANGGAGGLGGASSSSSAGGMGGATSSSNTAGGSGGQGGMMKLPTPIDCRDALESGQSTGDGVYLVDPDGDVGPEMPMQVYCDMTTDGGGWTLVYAYTFTNYAQFGNASNAVTPRPSWPLNVGDSVPVSTTTPLSLTDYNAMEFTRWADFGSEVLVRSNLTHWLHCSPGTGSIVTNTGGSMSCQVVMDVATVCLGTAPNLFNPSTGSSCRPSLRLSNGIYLCWDGRTNNNWPTHDACGTGSQNQVQGLGDPHGAILVRRP